MSMMWVKKQSKWAIIAAAVLIGGSLIMMDLPSSQGMTSEQSVGEVEGEEIPTASFQQELQNVLREEEARTGRQPTGADFARVREELFQYRVQSLLLRRMTRDYGLRATVEEMRDWLLKNPRDVAYALMQYEGPESVPVFLRDSTLDIMSFRGWMSQDSVYDRPGMRMLEMRLKDNMIPQLQIQQIFRSQVHRTDVEEAFLLETRENKAALRYYHVAAADFSVPVETVDEAALKAHFEATPDSFWFRDEAARLAYVRLPLLPSPEDSALMSEFAAEIRERAQGGESFEDLARSYSADPGSAEKGGRLPPAARNEWVPTFAEAAFALAPGQISQPVLSPFGWHIILKHGTVNEGGTTKAEVSHILLNITTGTETADRIVAAAEALKASAEKEGLEAAAAAAGLTVSRTPVFEKSVLSPLGPYVQGVTSFAFSPMERKAKISEVLQSDEGVYVLAREVNYAKGRSFERGREAIAQDLARVKRLEAARAEAEEVRKRLLASPNDAPARIGNATLSITGLLEGEGFAPGFGFGNAGLFQALNQKPGEWGPVIMTPEGAIVAQVTEKQSLSPAEKAGRIAAARTQGDGFQTSNLYQQWGQNLPKSVRVRNRLNEVYRN
jgi:peptidyl-prolyl cis-trans isomerase D